MIERGSRLWDRIKCDPLIISNRRDGLAASKGYDIHMEASLHRHEYTKSQAEGKG